MCNQKNRVIHRFLAATRVIIGCGSDLRPKIGSATDAEGTSDPCNHDLRYFDLNFWRLVTNLVEQNGEMGFEVILFW